MKGETMQAKLNQDYRCAPEGHTTITRMAGDVVSGRFAELALADGAATAEEKPTKEIKTDDVSKPA